MVFVLWLTGLPGSGKSSLARGVYEHYQSKGYRVEHLDGDVVRSIFPQTGFTKLERDEHIHRVGFLASLLERHGVIVIASFISPYAQARLDVRGMCQRMIEVFVDAPLEECERRDPKGLYKKARAGQIKHFTGIDDPYERPVKNEITIKTKGVPVEDSVKELLSKIDQIL